MDICISFCRYKYEVVDIDKQIDRYIDWKLDRSSLIYRQVDSWLNTLIFYFLLDRLMLLASWRNVGYLLSIGWVVFRVGHRFALASHQ